MQHVTLVFDRGELLWAVVVYCALQFVIEWALQRVKRKRGE